ncbi:MAG: Maf family protein, partial [Eubacteriales bacterium]
AISFLTALSKAPHSVYTGVCITQGEKTVTFHEHTIIQMRPITHEEICAYVAIGESLDKAGAYGIQNLGGLMVSSIQGDYHNVMGLPLSRVVEELAAFGITRTDIFTGAKEG